MPTTRSARWHPWLRSPPSPGRRACRCTLMRCRRSDLCPSVWRTMDPISLSAHKFYGPKGVGALIVRRGVRLRPVLHGGGQERGRRAGTENVAGLVGMARALELALADREGEATRQAALRDRLIR